MTTNFFESLKALNVNGDWIITIKSAALDRMLVSVLFNNEKTGDAAAKLIPPMVLKGTAKEMDEGFFAAIEKPVKQTAALFTNMEEYTASQVEARKQSKIEKDKEDKIKKEKDVASKKYEAAMKKVSDLEEQEKYREAYAVLPKVADFPAFEQEINSKKEELMEQFEQPSLFQNND